MTEVAVTFATYNQSGYTEKCLESMALAGDNLSQITVVDNNSSDDTLSVLSKFPLNRVIRNSTNLGCGVAWNQGILERQAEWTIVMNNDVLVSTGWISGLIDAAERHRLKIVSPAMIEGDDDYGFEARSKNLYMKAFELVRFGEKHAVCMAIHRSVFEEIGFFRPEPQLLGYEDTLFFAAADNAGVRSAIVGSSWIHHFGSVTQSAMKIERGLSLRASLGARNNSRLLNQSWIQRKLRKLKRKWKLNQSRRQEIISAGVTLHGVSEQGVIYWR